MYVCTPGKVPIPMICVGTFKVYIYIYIWEMGVYMTLGDGSIYVCIYVYIYMYVYITTLPYIHMLARRSFATQSCLHAQLWIHTHVISSHGLFMMDAPREHVRNSRSIMMRNANAASSSRICSQPGASSAASSSPSLGINRYHSLVTPSPFSNT